MRWQEAGLELVFWPGGYVHEDDDQEEGSSDERESWNTMISY